MAVESIRGNLSTTGRLRVNLAVGGGSEVTITPTYNSGIKIADYSIDGEPGEIYIPNYPQYTESVLYTYSGTTRQTAFNLSDSITNYDALVFTFDWLYLGSILENVDIIPTSKMEQNRFVQCGGEGRYNFVALGSDDTEIVLATITATWDGATIIREVRGIKY